MKGIFNHWQPKPKRLGLFRGEKAKCLFFLLSFSLLALPSLYSRQMEEIGCFALQGEWLYMLTAIDNPYFVVVKPLGTGASPIGDGVANNQDWQSGFRIAGRCPLSNYSTLEVRWTSFDFSNKKEVSNFALGMLLIDPDFIDLDNFAGTVRFRGAINFDAVEALLGVYTFSYYGLRVRSQAGLQYTHLRLKENEDIFIESGSPDSFVNNTFESRIWGIGPEIVFDFSQSLFCSCLSLKARLGGALLVSDTKAETFAFGNVSLLTTDANYKKNWRLVPTTNFRLGCDYKKHFCIFNTNFALNVEAGYEFIFYNRSLYRIRFLDDFNSTLAVNEYTDFSLHGPYISLSTYF